MNQPAQTVRIAPSILSADFGRLAEEVRAVQAAGADLIHVDVMDGHFVPNLTIGPLVVKAVRKITSLPLDVHLMIEDAERWAEDYIDAGADIVYVHPEACPHLHRVLQKIRARGKQAAAAINPATSLDVLDVSGRRVRSAVPSAMCAAGRYVVVWDGRDDDGALTPPGVYLVRLLTSSGTASTRLVRLQ